MSLLINLLWQVGGAIWLVVFLGSWLRGYLSQELCNTSIRETLPLGAVTLTRWIQNLSLQHEQPLSSPPKSIRYPNVTWTCGGELELVFFPLCFNLRWLQRLQASPANQNHSIITPHSGFKPGNPLDTTLDTRLLVLLLMSCHQVWVAHTSGSSAGKAEAGGSLWLEASLVYMPWVI